MSSFFLALAQALAPGALTQPSHTDGFNGTQIHIWKNLVFRPAAYTYEPFVLLALVGYLAWYVLAKNTNHSIATTWYQNSLPTLQSQFTLLSPSPSSSKPLIADGTSTFLSYASGRRNVLALHTTISLIPRPDPLALLWKFFLYRQYEVQCPAPEDEVKLMLTLLPPGAELAADKRELEKGVNIKGDGAANGAGLKTGTWAVLEKLGLNWVRTGRWDLTFPRLGSDSPLVPTDLAIMTEHVDVNTQLLSPLEHNAGSGLYELLHDPESRKVFKSLIISDLPSQWPKYALQHPAPLTITLTLRLPVSSALTQSYTHVILNLADLLLAPNGIKLQPEIPRKFKKARVEAWQQLEAVWSKDREEEEKEANGGLSKKDREEAEKRKKKIEEREKLSPKEKAKLEEKEKKKQQRKQQLKMQKR